MPAMVNSIAVCHSRATPAITMAGPGPTMGPNPTNSIPSRTPIPAGAKNARNPATWANVNKAINPGQKCHPTGLTLVATRQNAIQYITRAKMNTINTPTSLMAERRVTTGSLPTSPRAQLSPP